MNNNTGMPGVQNTQYQMPLFDRTVNTECNNDYTLPDYMCEIRRVLGVEAHVLPPAKYVGSYEAELGGTVEYQVLYVGADGRLYSAPLASEYALRVPLETSDELDMGEGVTCLADVAAESVTARVSGPRRLSVRARLCAHVCCLGICTPELDMQGETPPQSLQRMEQEVEQHMAFVCTAEEPIHLQDSMELGEGDNVRVVSAKASVVIPNSSCENGRVRLVGEAVLSLLLCREESGTVYCEERRIPLQTDVACDEAEDGCQCRVLAHVKELSVTVEEGRVSSELTVECEIRIRRPMRATYTADIYSTEHQSECSYRTYRLSVPAAILGETVKQEHSVSLSELGIAENAEIVCAEALPILTHWENGGLCGTVRYTLVTLCDGEYSTAECAVPLCVPAEEAEVSGFFATALPMTAQATVQGEEIVICSELFVNAELLTEQVVRGVSEVRFGEKLAKQGHELIICYPEKGDTLWTVAKRYSVPISRIMGAEADDLHGVRYLLIP